MKNLLYISYYFPPQGLSGVLRSLKFVKYLPGHGYRPLVLAARGFSFLALDQSLLPDIPSQAIVKRVRVAEPYSIGFRNPGRAREAGSGLSGWLALPDTRALWIRPGLRAGTRLVREYDPCAIIATSPPVSSLLLGARLSARTGIPLILDYRDLWEGNFERRYPTRLHRAINIRWEKDVLGRASAVVVINPAMADFLRGRFGVSPAVIPPGYDPDDFPGAPVPGGETMRILYAGSFVRQRNPGPFFRGLGLFLSCNPGARVHLTWAGVSSWPVDEMAHEAGLRERFTRLAYMAHREVCSLMEQSHLLWVLVGPGEGPEVSTAKAYEYLGARRPLLVTAPGNTDAARLAREVGAYLAEPDDPQAIANALGQAYSDFTSGRMRFPSGTEPYSATERTAKLAEILESL